VRSDPLSVDADLAVVHSVDDVSEAAAAGGRGGDRPPVVTATPQRKRRRVGGLAADLPLALVISGVGVGLLVIAMHHFRWGNLAISISVLAGALFRLVLPARKAGLLVVRSRFTDVVTMGIIGGTLMLLAAVTST
jgi:DUF3017 family protein